MKMERLLTNQRNQWASLRVESLNADSYVSSGNLYSKNVTSDTINGSIFPSASYTQLESAFASGEKGYFLSDGQTISMDFGAQGPKGDDGARGPQGIDRKSTRLNSSHALTSRMPSSA